MVEFQIHLDRSLKSMVCMFPQQIAKVTATDSDLGPNGQFLYSLQSGQDHFESFIIDPQSKLIHFSSCEECCCLFAVGQT